MVRGKSAARRPRSGWRIRGPWRWSRAHAADYLCGAIAEARPVREALRRPGRWVLRADLVATPVCSCFVPDLRQ